VRLACQRATSEGLDTGDYNITASRSESTWYVMFDNKSQPKAKGWPNHFVVRVDLDGTTDLLK
jgi:hypothetical protein